MDDNNHIDFDAPATLRKWPSIKNERASSTDGPYLIVDGTLDDYIRQFMAKPVSQHHLYEIHTAPQGKLGIRCPLGAVVLKKSFLTDERIFLEPLVRCSCGDVRDHIVSHKNDHRPPCRSYRALQRPPGTSPTHVITFGGAR